MTEIVNEPNYEDWTRHSKGLHERYVDPYKINIKGRELSILQENVMASEDLGNTVWDGSLVLSHYFANNKIFPEDFWKNKRVFELGSGTGIVGTVIGSLGADIIITDKHPQTELIERTVEYNKMDNNKIKVQEFLWGSSISELVVPFDVIVASECIYYMELIEPLCRSMEQLSGDDTVIFVSFEHHNEESVEFFIQTAAAIFDLTTVPTEDMDAVYRSDKIKVLEMRKKKSSK